MRKQEALPSPNKLRLAINGAYSKEADQQGLTLPKSGCVLSHFRVLMVTMHAFCLHRSSDSVTVEIDWRCKRPLQCSGLCMPTCRGVLAVGCQMNV